MFVSANAGAARTSNATEAPITSIRPRIPSVFPSLRMFIMCSSAGGEEDAGDEGPQTSQGGDRLERIARRILRCDSTKAMESGCRFSVDVPAAEHMPV